MDLSGPRPFADGKESGPPGRRLRRVCGWRSDRPRHARGGYELSTDRHGIVHARQLVTLPFGLGGDRHNNETRQYERNVDFRAPSHTSQQAQWLFALDVRGRFNNILAKWNDLRLCLSAPHNSRSSL
jgi:hypothetical protein